MEDVAIISIFGLVVVVFLLLLILVLNFKWVMIGLNLMFKRFQSKNNVGLLFIRSKGGNFGLPKIVDLNRAEEEFTIGGKKQVIPITREDYEKNGLFFGLPYKLMNQEDVKTSIGLYYQETDEQGDLVKDEKGIAQITLIKNSVSISGSMIKALVDEKAISDALKDFLQKNQFILIIVFVNIIVGGIGAYMGYELVSTHLPNLEVIVRSGFSEIGNKLDLILEAVQ